MLACGNGRPADKRAHLVEAAMLGRVVVGRVVKVVGPGSCQGRHGGWGSLKLITAVAGAGWLATQLSWARPPCECACAAAAVLLLHSPVALAGFQCLKPNTEVQK